MKNSDGRWQQVGSSRYLFRARSDSIQVRGSWSWGRWLLTSYLVFVIVFLIVPALTSKDFQTVKVCSLVVVSLGFILLLDVFVMNRVVFRSDGIWAGIRWIAIGNVVNLELCEQAVDATVPVAAPTLRVRMKNGRVKNLLCDLMELERGALLDVKERAEGVMFPGQKKR